MGYQLATLARSQRWVGPLVTYLAFLGFVYASEAGPAVIAYGVTAYALFVVVAGDQRDAERGERGRAAGDGGGRGWAGARPGRCSGGGGVRCGRRVVAAVGWALVANAASTHGVKAILGGLALHAVFALLGLGVGALLGAPSWRLRVRRRSGSSRWRCSR